MAIADAIHPDRVDGGRSSTADAASGEDQFQGRKEYEMKQKNFHSPIASFKSPGSTVRFLQITLCRTV
jgi:hypothetical protein